MMIIKKKKTMKLEACFEKKNHKKQMLKKYAKKIDNNFVYIIILQ